MIDEKTSNIKECEGGQGGYLRENFNRLSFLTQFLRVKIEEISALLAEVVMVSSLLARLKFELRSSSQLHCESFLRIIYGVI